MKYELDEDTMNWLSTKVNRARHQLNELFNLVDGDLIKLIRLEEQLHNCFVSWCPGDKEAVDKVMSMTPKRNWKIT